MMLSALACVAPRLTPLRQSLKLLHLTQVNPAARKGTREKARKKKVKAEIKKVGFIPAHLRKKAISTTDKHIDDSWKQIPADNVYPGRYYRWRIYSIAEAIEAHRETHHPTVYDIPNAPINVCIEMNMKGEKQTKFVSGFQKMVMIDHAFDHGEERKILALVKDEEIARKSQEAGAALAGGVELIKDIQVGKVTLNEFQYIVAHPNILAELISVRGLMKKKFPNPKSETLGLDVPDMITRYLNGINYKAVRDVNQEDFGTVDACIGTLQMPTEHLKSNLLALLKDVNQSRPKRPGPFITRVIMTSPPSGETLKIDPKEFPFEDAKGKNVVKKKKGSKAEEVVEKPKPEDSDDEGEQKKDVAG